MIILFLLLVIAAIVLGVLGVVVHGLLYLLFYWRRRAHHRLLPRRPVDATPNSQEASPSVRVSAVAQAIAARAFGVTAARLPELVYLEARRLRERAGCPARGRRAPSRPLAGRTSSANPAPGRGDDQSRLDDVGARVTGLQDAEQRGELALVTAGDEPVAASGIHVAPGQGE
jgi:hypothetical protein